MAFAKVDSSLTVLSNYEFDTDDNSIDVELFCVVCKKLANDAVVSNVCGCSYCYKCFDEYTIDEHRFCPGGKAYCKEEPIVFGKNALKSSLLNRKISQIKVKCPNDSCSVRVQLIEMSDHLRLCTKQPMNCPYAPIGCNSANVSKDTILSHLNGETLTHSELLIELIRNMGNEFNLLKDDFQKIKLENVSLKEELKEVRNEMEMKVNEEIELIKKEMFFQMKEIEGIAKDVKSKLETKPLKRKSTKKENRNLSLVEELSGTKNEMEVRVNEEKDEMERRSNDQIQQIEEVCLNKMNVTMMIDGLRKEVDEVMVDVNEMRIERKKCDDEIEKRFIYWIKCNNLCPNIYGDFIWRNDRCSKNTFKEIFSESFYKDNYRLCLSLFINDYSDNIGLYCHIMKGRRDAKIMWPMNHTVTLSIINQSALDTHNSERFKCVFNKPSIDKDKYIGSSSFIKYLSIKDNQSIIVNDSIVVSCLVSEQ